MTARFVHGLGEIYLFSGRAADAVAAANKALEIDSTAAGSHYLRAAALTALKRFDDAAAVLEWCIPIGCGDEGRSLLGYVYGVTGNREAARRIADTFIAQWTAGKAKPPIPYLTAQVFAGLGETSLALDWLERDAGNSVNMLYLAIDPTLRSLHGERRFDALLRKVGLKK
jgi:tetratricopeptide (TPR) repeat protein